MSFGSVHGKVCFLTGATGGIGSAIANILALDGKAIVVLCDRPSQNSQLETLCRTITEAGGKAFVAKPADTTNFEEVKAAVASAESLAGHIDILICNAGVMYYTLMKNLLIDQWNQTVDVNCKGTLNSIGAVLPKMIERKKGGHILMITSDAGKTPFPGYAVYCGSKFFLEGLGASMRQELVEHNIKVTHIQPGDVRTPLHTYSTDKEAVNEYNPIKQKDSVFLNPVDIGRAVLFALAQPEHCAVNEILVQPNTD